MATQNALQVVDPKTGKTEPQYIDVGLHGVQVSLFALKAALRTDKKLKQENIADATAPFNGGVALHQTSISGYLIGKVMMPDVVVSTLESIFTVGEAQAMAAQVTTPMPATPTPRNRTAAPVFAGAMAAVSGAKPDPIVSQVHQAAVALEAFPLDKAYEVAADTRKAKDDGSVTTTFSLRKLQQWGRAYYLLLAEGYDPKESLSGAFHLAAEGKTYGEDQKFLRELFEAKFGFDVKPPKARVTTSKKDGRHPMSYLIEPMVREGLHTWLAGPTGAGKTHTLLDIAERLNRPIVRFQGKGDATTDDFVGGFGVRNDNGTPVTEFQYGVLPQAMKNGAILYIDEITSLPPEVTFELHAVMEGKPLLLSKNRGEVVEPTPGFTIVAADNSLGLGEATEYVGTNVMNEALRDRFLFVHLDYMPPTQEKDIVGQFLQGFTSSRGWQVAA